MHRFGDDDDDGAHFECGNNILSSVNASNALAMVLLLMVIVLV